MRNPEHPRVRRAIQGLVRQQVNEHHHRAGDSHEQADECRQERGRSQLLHPPPIEGPIRQHASEPMCQRKSWLLSQEELLTDNRQPSTPGEAG